MTGRRITVGLVALSIGSLGFGSRNALAQDGYSSPFGITLDPAITAWTSDFSARQAVIGANTTPPMAVWYSSTTSYAGYPYGPLNPQLYSSGSLASPDDATALQSDRGSPVLNVTTNALPAGIDPTVWQRQRVMAAANVLLQAGTHYQHLHLPNFDPAQVTSGTGSPWIPVSTNATLQSSWQLAHGVSGTMPNPYAAAYGQPQPGIDCTDFSAYVYSLALGVQMHSGDAGHTGAGAGGNRAGGARRGRGGGLASSGQATSHPLPLRFRTILMPGRLPTVSRRLAHDPTSPHEPRNHGCNTASLCSVVMRRGRSPCS